MVLSQGMGRRLQADPATLGYLEQRGVTVHLAETRETVTIYNTLAERTLVVGLFHSTC